MELYGIGQVSGYCLPDTKHTYLLRPGYPFRSDGRYTLDVSLNVLCRNGRAADLCSNSSMTPIAGSIPIQISFLIAFSQLVPAHTVTLFRGIISLRVPRFPLLYILLITTLAFTPLLSAASFFLATLGFMVSWTYLRFYKTAFPDLDTNQSSGLRGDASETFAFTEFFPDATKGPIGSISTIVYNLLVAVKICTPFSAADISASRSDSYIHRSSAPGSTRAETERRRALALKALDQRLHAATAGSSMTAKTPQPPSTVATDVTVQPMPSMQTAMTSQPSNMLGETNYVPEREGEGEKSGTKS
jgi:hypothetical protein